MKTGPPAVASSSSGFGSTRMLAGVIAAVLIAGVYGTIALSRTYSPTSDPLWGDEATYLMMGQSLVVDRDLAYRKTDLTRAIRELGPNGPNGLFLKLGQDVTGARLTPKAPFLRIDGVEDSNSSSRLFYGKSFAYPLFAAPFVAVFGTKGFLVFNTLLLVIVFVTAYAFLSARSPVLVALVLAGGFVFATITPVYWAWITPELFNCALGVLAYFCWLYKLVATTPPAPGWRWLRDRRSDIVAGAIIGVATFSKVTNVLWLLPIAAWWLYRRGWRRAIAVSLCCAALTAGLFGINVAVMGDWNYQGGNRKTFYSDTRFPFAAPDLKFDNTGDDKSRTDALTDVLFDPQVFWSNLRANLIYFVAGRYTGIGPYFFAAVFGLLAVFAAFRRAPAWQWFVIAGLVVQVILAVITQPYTYFGSGGSIGNRYFMTIYGLWVFLLPATRSLFVAAIPLIVGGAFVAPMVLQPFGHSEKPSIHANNGLWRQLPVELTAINDLPINTLGPLAKRDFYKGVENGLRHFQVYYLDDHMGLPEQDESVADKPWSVWVYGHNRAEFVLKVNQPVRQLVFRLSAGPVGTTATVKVCGTTSTADLQPGEAKTLTIDLCKGFPYRFYDITPPPLEWVISVASSDGFFPRTYNPTLTDTRFLGVRVTPSIIR